MGTVSVVVHLQSYFLTVGFYFFFKVNFYWSIVFLQYRVSFYCMAKWISHPCTYISPPFGASVLFKTWDDLCFTHKYSLGASTVPGHRARTLRRYTQTIELRGRCWLQAQERPEEVVCLIWVWWVHRNPTEGWHVPKWRPGKESSRLSKHVRRLGLSCDVQKGSVRAEAWKGGTARSWCILKFSWRHWPWPLRLWGSYDCAQPPLFPGMVLNLFIGSPLENPEVNPEILVAIRKEYEDQRENYQLPLVKKVSMAYGAPCPGVRMPPGAGRGLYVLPRAPRAGEAAPPGRPVPSHRPVTCVRSRQHERSSWCRCWWSRLLE